MKKSDFESFQRGLAQAKAHIAGDRPAGFVVHEPVDVRRLRARIKLTRKQFALKYRLDHRTIEQWEQGRRRPDRGTETYLRLIEKEPDKVAELTMLLEA